MKKDVSEEQLLRWSFGNLEAASFLRLIFEIARIADDIVDVKDGNTSASTALLMSKCLIEMPSNTFYRSNSALLLTSINEAIWAWDLSNLYQKSTVQRLQAFGFVYREGPARVAVAVALICGGTAHARQTLQEVSETMSSQTLDSWIGEVNGIVGR